MFESSAFAQYDLAVGLVTGVGFAYFLLARRTVVEYHRFLLLAVAGLLLFLVGGPVTELVAPAFVHWVHGVASLLVVLGLYDPLENDLRREAWAEVLLQEPVQVRQQADWMAPVDDAILGLFHSTDLVLTPSVIAYNIDYSREEVNRRLVELEERGLVRRPERGKYRISTLGQQYIEGAVSPGLLDWRRYFGKGEGEA